jgi:micrococcal nuclease
MRPLARVVAVALVLAACGFVAAYVADHGTEADEQATVVRVVDGDTLQVLLPHGLEKVRLIGVDTPELHHPKKPVERFAKEATEFVRRTVLGKTVRLAGEDGQPDRDRYNRLLRYVFLADGACLNAEIVRQGYGHAYVKYPFARLEEFRGLEREAREASRGLWASEDGAQAGR